MKLNDFNYHLPLELIAQTHAKPRDHSRLLVMDKNTGELSHNFFYDIIDFFNPGDVLVINNSKVFPARLFGFRNDTGGKVEILLHKQISESQWEVIGKNLKLNSLIVFNDSSLEARVIKKNEEICTIEFSQQGSCFFDEIERIGQTPLPPYIKKEITEDDKTDYQTIFAKERGSAAAPTAGLHFTPNLLRALENKGVVIAEVTLHVGLGTFASVKAENVEDHKIHSEYYTVSPCEIEKIIKAKKDKKRIVAVGTTSTRVLEHIYSSVHNNVNDFDLSGWTSIYIYPGYKFKCVDGLITNFHLPKSTLLLLVSAFAGKNNTLNAYKKAVEEEYKFFSYGDAMLII